jgi:hypothetical protein
MISCPANKIFQTYNIQRGILAKIENDKPFNTSQVMCLCDGPGYFIGGKVVYVDIMVNFNYILGWNDCLFC